LLRWISGVLLAVWRPPCSSGSCSSPRSFRLAGTQSRGRIQDRLGPTRVGGKFGWLQTLADGIKLLVKEDIIPRPADQMLFRVGPYIAAGRQLYGVYRPAVRQRIVGRDMNIAILFMLAIMSSEVFGIILIGYGSGSKWPCSAACEGGPDGELRNPMALCILCPSSRQAA
jgi:NADH-quinone oxidoreductase subunit H